jgi:hypothetical protein
MDGEGLGSHIEEDRAINELSLDEPRLSKLAYLKISRARARAELFAELKI